MDYNMGKALIVGLGKSGIGAMEVLFDRGWGITVYDKKMAGEMDRKLMDYLKRNGIKHFLGTNPIGIGDFDMVVMSPGISPETDFVVEAAANGAEVVGELELAYRLSKCKYVAITGTNGKTTTTTLVGEIFAKAGEKAEVVGNVGIPVIRKAPNAGEDQWMITEVSSFQLETVSLFHPLVSAVLNITPDHMDRHGTLENYAKIKGKIYEKQKEDDYFVVNYDDPEALALKENCPATVVGFSRTKECVPGCFLKKDRIVIAPCTKGTPEDGKIIDICGVGDLKIPGGHNLENAMAAAAIAYFAGINPEIIGAALQEFEGVEHRMEFVALIEGVRYINDSKGTNPDASIKALEAIDGGIVLIAGGYNKDASFKELIKTFKGKVKVLILMGETGPLIKEEALKSGFNETIMCSTMEECVYEARRIAEHGDTVLLSPACASWDMYGSYEERGEHFKSCIKKISDGRGLNGKGERRKE
ncbi:MAG: UDP-N-acetylmuramoyl-L-alanine--D-glutamate ligase [Anaerovoracaceae bacterium]|jgi:UDP-N-acetylmuramoylalanine--D-glutamate ligase